MKKGLILLSFALFVACAAPKLLTPTQDDANRGAKEFQGFTLADLNSGKTLYESKCSACHGLKDPASRSEEKWKKIVPKMAAKSLKRGKGEIDAHSQDLIIKYLITMGPATKAK